MQCGRRSFCDAFQEFLSTSGLSRAQIDEVEAACRLRRSEAERSARLFPCVAETLRRLTADGLSLAVLTNAAAPSVEIQEKLDNLGIGGHFQAVWSSLDLEAAKPAAICYQTTLASLKLCADQVAYVGCDARALVGAAQVGLRTVAMNHGCGVGADLFVASIAELPAAIRSWRTTARPAPQVQEFPRSLDPGGVR